MWRSLERIGLDPWGVIHHAGDQEEGQNSHWDVDEKDPAPGEVVGDPAAQSRADGGRKHGDETVEGEGLAAFVSNT